MVEFKEWPKIPRGGPDETVTITEKIDGTNACIIVEINPGDYLLLLVRSLEAG